MRVLRTSVLIALLLSGASVPLFAQDYASLGKAFVRLLASRQFDKAEAQFDARMQAALPVEKLAATWDSILGQVGAFQSITGVRTSQVQGMTVVVVNCAFARAAIDTQIAFDRQSKIAGLYFKPGTAPAAEWSAPAYADPRSFRERAVTVADGTFRLPGTLAIPDGKGAFPAIVLVHGSGPNDADETIGPNKPFKDLAWGLASRGIAVLRYVKRTKQYPAESAANRAFTVNDETVDDARAAVDLLASTPEVDPKHVFILGHSLGGMMAPRIARGDAKVAGLVILAGNARPLEDSVVAQLRYLASLQPGPEMNARVDAAQKAAAEIRSPSLRPDSVVDLLGASIPGAYFLDLRNYRPAEVAASLRIPMLILQGGHDYQVTRVDFDVWKRALGERKDVTFHLYPELTHLFIASGSSKPSPADYDVPGHVAPEVIAEIASWIDSNQAR